MSTPMTAAAADAIVTLQADFLGPTPVELRALHGFEGSSTIFELTASLAVDATLAVTAPTLFSQARITFRTTDGQERWLTGFVDRATVGKTLEEHQALLELVIQPKLALLGKRISSRVFQDLTLVEVVTTLLTEHAVKHRWLPTRKYPKREYCVQYQESDLAFVERLLGEAGIHFHFAEGASETDVVFTDGTAMLVPVADAPTLLASSHNADDSARKGAEPLRENQIVGLAASRRVEPTAALLRDYDFKRPQLDLSIKSKALSPALGYESASLPPSPTPGLSAYHHHGQYEEDDINPAQAEVELEQLRRDIERASGATGCRILAPGYLLSIKEHDLAALNESYVVIRVEHSFERTPKGFDYHAKIWILPERQPYRPHRPTRKVFQVIESATVVGPRNRDVHTDEYGRINIRFHWDLRDDALEKTSCFVRVMQPWAGASWGSQFIPRVGTEVLVSFIGGDIDRPIVLGSLVNAQNPHPFPLPAGTRNGIRTQTSPHNGGYNEVSFEDSAGKEELFLRAERDLRETIQADRVSDIGKNRQTRISGSDFTTVTELRSTHIQGDDIITIQGAQKTTVSGGAHVDVSGSSVSNAGGDQLTNATGTFGVHAGGGVRLASDGFITVRVDNAANQGEITNDVAGTFRASASKQLLIRGDESVRIQCGATEIVLTPDGIKMKAKTISLEASESFEAKGKGPAMSLADNAQILAKKVSIYSESGALELDKNATIWGAAISLQKPDKSPPPKDPEKETTETKPVALKFLDDEHEPYKNKNYQLAAGGEKYRGKLDGDGGLKTDVPKDALTAEITIWIDEYPEGRTRKYGLKLDKVEGSKTPRGAKTRLKALGYFPGEVDDTADQALTDSIRRFQTDYEIDPASGALDAKTTAQLEKLYGQ